MANKPSLAEVHSCLESSWEHVKEDYFDGRIRRESDLVASMHFHLRRRFERAAYRTYRVFTEAVDFTGMKTDLVITYGNPPRLYVAIEAKISGSMKPKARKERARLKAIKDKGKVKRLYLAYIWEIPKEKPHSYDGYRKGSGLVSLRLENPKRFSGVAFTVSQSKKTRKWQKGCWGECKGWGKKGLKWEVLLY